MGRTIHTGENELYKVIFLAAFILACIIGYFIYVIIRQKNRVLSWQEARIKAEIETLENERKRIASDLHDDIGPLLSALKLHVNHVEPIDEEGKSIIEKSGAIIDDVIGRFREIAYDLLPNTLVRKGLVSAINEFVGKMNKAYKLRIEFIHNDNISLSQKSELNLYRIVQEVTHNTIKHAEASHLSITIKKEMNQIAFTASDNGKGFSYNLSAQQSGGLGLLNIQNRVTLLSGILSIKTEPMKGTTYFITIPLNAL